jgi:hypothetical protein
MAESLTSQALPQTNATITIRIIKSFKYRTERSLVLHNVNLITSTVAQLKEMAKQGQCALLVSLYVQSYCLHVSGGNWMEALSECFPESVQAPHLTLAGAQSKSV